MFVHKWKFFIIIGLIFEWIFNKYRIYYDFASKQLIKINVLMRAYQNHNILMYIQIIQIVHAWFIFVSQYFSHTNQTMHGLYIYIFLRPLHSDDYELINLFILGMFENEK